MTRLSGWLIVGLLVTPAAFAADKATGASTPPASAPASSRVQVAPEKKPDPKPAKVAADKAKADPNNIKVIDDLFKGLSGDSSQC